MAGFFLGNGFGRVVDERGYEKPNFVGSWDATDEDLFNKAYQEFTRLKEQNQPFAPPNERARHRYPVDRREITMLLVDNALLDLVQPLTGHRHRFEHGTTLVQGLLPLQFR